MTSSADSFDSAIEMLGWAKEAFDEAKTVARAFFEAGNAAIVKESDHELGHILIKIRVTKKLPGSIARKMTEAILNTRLTFDRSTYALLVSHSLIRPNKTFCFPWRQSVRDLEIWFENNSIPPELRQPFRSVEPYPTGDGYTGGDDVIRRLAQVSGKDKHLINIRPNAFVHQVGYDATVFGEGISIYGPEWDPVKDEMIVARVAFGADFDASYEARFEVAFNEDPPLSGENIFTVTRAFLSKAESFTQAARYLAKR